MIFRNSTYELEVCSITCDDYVVDDTTCCWRCKHHVAHRTVVNWWLDCQALHTSRPYWTQAITVTVVSVSTASNIKMYNIILRHISFLQTRIKEIFRVQKVCSSSWTTVCIYRITKQKSVGYTSAGTDQCHTAECDDHWCLRWPLHLNH